MEGTMAVITNWAANFAPRNWAYCNGQLISIPQNTALFSLLGTTYGGNGQTTFALPNLQGRTAVGTGQSTTGSYYTLGEVSGTATVTLMIGNIPPHTHTATANMALQANNAVGSQDDPSGAYPGLLNSGYGATPDGTMAAPGYATTIGVAGSSIPLNNMSPFLCVNYIICMYGIYPSRN